MDIPLENVLKMISIASDKRDPYARNHEERTAKLCARLGRAIGLSGDDLYWLDVAARVHDIGKVFGVTSTITNKPARLTDGEYLQMQYHCAMGAHILAPLDLDPRVNSAVLHHHENWDGSGYPSELQGEDIPLFARVIRICDVYDSVIEERVYRKTMSRDDALLLMQTYRNHFDPVLLHAFTGLDLGDL